MTIEKKTDLIQPEERLDSVVIDKSQRWGFVDQFRGLVMLLFFVAQVTWVFSGSRFFPTYLNHGWKFFDIPQHQIITLIDIGQQIFMFVMGIMIPAAYRRHLKEGGKKSAWGQALIRLGVFWLIAIVMDAPDWKAVFFGSTFGNLAMGMLCGTIGAALISKPDKRFLVVIILLILHPVLWGIGTLNGLDMYALDKSNVFPLHLLGFVALAIMGGCVWDWFAANDDPKIGIKQRILPISTIFLTLTPLIDYLQPADHYMTNPSLVLMAIGSCGFLFTIFYMLEKEFQFKIPGLSPVGRNVLLMFILALPVETFLLGTDVVDLVSFFETNSILAMVWLVVVCAVYIAMAVAFDRKGWYFTPSLFIRVARKKKGRHVK